VSNEDCQALTRAFQALADPIRRAIVERLCRGDATVKQLAEPFSITKQAISRHVQVLEAAGLVTRVDDRQWRPVHLDTTGLLELMLWINRQRLIAEQLGPAPAVQMVWPRRAPAAAPVNPAGLTVVG
jgi:DNA-binding transcriptional ArsR family regulator